MDISLFKLIRGDQLSEEEFEEYPVWSEFYDSDEFDEIVSWGIDRDWLEKEIRENHNGNEHCVYTLLQTTPLPPRMRIFIKAEFQTPKGAKLTGYVVNEDAYCVHIFYGNENFIFNDHPMLEDLNEKERSRLQVAIKNPKDEIFPLHYRTEFFDSKGERIEGDFLITSRV